MKTHFGKSRVVPFTEPTQTYFSTATLMTRTMKVCEVSGADEDDAAELCAAGIGGYPELYKQAGPLPWVVSAVAGHPPMAFPADLVEAALREMPVPAELLDRYHPLHNTKKMGWLLYYSNPFHLTSARTKFYPNRELPKKDFEAFIVQDSLGNYLDEMALMDRLIFNQAGRDWSEKMAGMRENAWVRARSTDWNAGFILPEQWMTYGLGMALQFLRWRSHFAHHPQPRRNVLAWETMWLGKARVKV